MGPNSDSEVPVFVQTNLGTHIAIAVSPDITAGDFKRELEQAHIDCFPELGILDFKRVMYSASFSLVPPSFCQFDLIVLLSQVKRKSKFYSLPDLLPLKLAYWGCNKLWFVNVVGRLSNELGKFQAPKSLVAEKRANNHPTDECIVVNKNCANIKPKKRKLGGLLSRKAVQRGLLAVVYESRKRKKRKRRYKVNKFTAGNNSERLEQECLRLPKGTGVDSKELLHSVQVWDSNPTIDSPCESFSGTVSIQGIIDRYFSNLLELNHIGSPSISEGARRAGQNQLGEQGDAEDSTSVRLSSRKQHSVIKPKTTKKLLPSTSPDGCNCVGLRRKYERSEVGQRLVTASNTLRLCRSKQRSQESSLSKVKKFWEEDVYSVAKRLVFEIDLVKPLLLAFTVNVNDLIMNSVVSLLPRRAV
ncbi:hypothetical protein Cgig2_028001 [Carnegiea gigantea]|uniref:Uncharacterized protein n=1 Tax=Carnegiea gigantea TaxID=171969 RepID=A0A9Q1GW16_9CARY|nr:hypothetical protein Cgig2_028001 [Carnegiea gigantea]